MKKQISDWMERRIVTETRNKIGDRVQSPDTILDLGCGERGSFDYPEGQRIVCSDKYEERLSKINNTEKVIADVEKKLPFKSNFFSVVVFGGVIQYLENYKGAIKEINRILTEDGILILATVNRGSLLRKLGFIKKHPKKEDGEFNIFSIKEISSLLESEEFKIISISGVDFTIMPKSLSSNMIIVSQKKNEVKG